VVVLNKPFVFPCHHYFITHLLINFTFMKKNRICYICKKFFQQLMIFFMARFFGKGGGRIQICKHKDALFFFGIDTYLLSYSTYCPAKPVLN